MYEIPTVNIILSGEKLNVFLLSLWRGQFCAGTTAITHNTESPSRCNKAITYVQIGQGEINLSLLSDGMVVYIQKLKGATERDTHTHTEREREREREREENRTNKEV